jgi:hypothetical protein
MHKKWRLFLYGQACHRLKPSFSGKRELDKKYNCDYVARNLQVAAAPKRT